MKTVCFVCVLALAGVCRAGTITNGSFETGDFTGWDTLGPATVGSYSPTDGLVDAKLSNMSTYVGSDLNTFFGSTTIVSDYGTGIKTTVTVDAGEELAVDWRVFSGQNAGPFGDYGLYLVDGVKATLFSDPGFPVAGFLDQKTLYLNLAPGTHTIGFTAMNFADDRGETDLFIDNVRFISAASLAAVPLPVALWPGLVMLGLCGAVSHRRHPRTQQATR